MGDKPISFRDENGNFVSAADVWNEKVLRTGLRRQCQQLWGMLVLD